MSDAVSMRFESELRAPAGDVWKWITSVEGISAEMWPYFRMTSPNNVRSLSDIELRPGVRMFRSHVFLFGVLPIDYSDMTLMQLDPGQGFVEQSPMGSMKLWRHERRIAPSSSNPEAVHLVDELTFQPRMAKNLVCWFIKRVFTHRHRVLREHFGGAQPAAPADGPRAARSAGG
jgi:ligand-binding SRPBCC domain-containing protein